MPKILFLKAKNDIFYAHIRQSNKAAGKYVKCSEYSKKLWTNGTQMCYNIMR